ncbi:MULTISPECIES: peptidylprolyl isomerase [unclassified Rhizobium]|uniref:peptidylprolyl isomerase n=1 Tax=Rhizobium TaxID=379 RepID=UPI00084BDB2C|nr:MULTISPECIES: peptidylprolyl isomerase [unclassified Rhizobium]OEC99071.1 peptidylprolyl isomerase [Rhizobium sp. YK2]QYA11703.1 SurA N-terminal domain-containing protein [Rhizobium sp. AB2/73]UEQ82367.1 SurA N-terminal domain-containing protein [Rhizobium sp. AB2/73]
MFDVLRKIAQTWVAKGLLLLLAAAFGVWGVERSLITGGGSNTVVTVGDQHIDTNEFRLAYRRQIQAISQQLRMQITPEQARAFGIGQQTVAQLVAGASLDQLAADMNLGLSQDRLAKLIGDDPAFKAANGAFDRQKFDMLLRNSNISPDDYIKERSKVAIRSQIVEAVSNGFVAPAVLADAVKQYHDETRSIDYLLLTNANIDPVKAPADDVLQKWFDGVKSKYRAPEYRKFAYVKLQAEDIADVASVTDDEVRAQFDKRKDSFTTPATRTIEQLTFANKDLANAAADALKTGTTFDQLVSDQGKKPSDVLLGTFTKDQVPDKTVAEAAFAVSKEGGTTPVVDGSFGPVILRVTNVKNETAKNFDDVKEDIRKQIALGNAANEITSVHDKFEDLRGSGASLQDAASQLKLKLVTIDTIDQTGLDQNGNEIKDLPARQQLISEVFKADQGGNPAPLTVGNDGYIWYDVMNVTPDHDRPLSEVREKAVADWTAEQQKVGLAAKAAELKQEAQKGKSLADIAAPLGIAVESKTGITRSTDDPVLGRGGIAAAFSGPVDTAANAVGADDTTQILLKVTDVNDNPTTDALSNDDQQVAQIANAAGDDILDQIVGQLQSKYAVTVNQSLAEQAMSR